MREQNVSKRLAGRVALVTGASRGIGYGIAERFVAEGAKVVLTARSDDQLQRAVSELGGTGEALGVAGRADDTEHQQLAMSRTLEEFGRLDVLVNNTGINPVYGPMIDQDIGVARKIFDVNALAALAWSQVAVHGWMDAHGGVIVNVSSVSALGPAEGIGLYGASKAMLSYITGQLALELGPDIRVNAVAPAVVKTKFAALLYEGKEDEASAKYPLKRLGVPGDVAAAVAFLASDEASWITGHTLILDGGSTLLRAF